MVFVWHCFNYLFRVCAKRLLARELRCISYQPCSVARLHGNGRPLQLLEKSHAKVPKLNLSLHPQACISQVGLSMSMATDSDTPPTRPQLIEVERKFHLPDTAALEDHLSQLGASLIASSSFTDIYYDTSECHLALSDHWLRQRGNKWELKCAPPNHRNNREDQRNTQYAEYDCPGKIANILSDLLGDSGKKDLSQTLESLGCEVLAKYTTVRRTYSLDDMTVDLDTTDFGYSVGEIEVMVDREEEMAHALMKVDQLAQKLGG